MLRDPDATISTIVHSGQLGYDRRYLSQEWVLDYYVNRLKLLESLATRKDTGCFVLDSDCLINETYAVRGIVKC